MKSFLTDLSKDLQHLADADISCLLARKHSEEGPTSGPITLSDYRYYMEQELREKYSVDHDLIKEYFPLDTVVANMLDIYQRMLSLRFEPMEGPSVRKWHEDVKLYAVYDDREGKEGAAIGFFYLDFHPRDG